MPFVNFGLDGHPLKQLQRILVTCVIGGLAVFVSLDPYLTERLQWQRVSSQEIQAWQILTCHLTHWSREHLFWDLTTFLALGAICETLNRRQFVVTLSLSAIAIPLTTIYFHPHLSTYRGLSGIDSALFVLLACLVGSIGYQQRDWFLVGLGLAAWVVFAAKSGYELATGNTLFVESSGDFVALPIAHLVGAAAGTLVWACVVSSTKPTDGCSVDPRR